MRSKARVKTASTAFFFVTATLLVFLSPHHAGARRRKATVRGILKAPRNKAQCSPPKKAYWSFEVPNLPHPPCRPVYQYYLITLDTWDAKRAKKLSGGERKNPVVTLKGVDFAPKLIVVPKDAQSYDVTLRNTDRFKHAIYSPKHKGIGVERIESSTSSTVRFESLPALSKGAVHFIPLKCKLFSHMNGGVAFVRSTAYAVVGPRGRFVIRRVPRGEYTLRVWRKGQKVHERKIKVGRRGARLDLDLLKKKERASKKDKKEASDKKDEEKEKSSSRRRRRRRRRRSRSRRRRR